MTRFPNSLPTSNPSSMSSPFNRVTVRVSFVVTALLLVGCGGSSDSGKKASDSVATKTDSVALALGSADIAVATRADIGSGIGLSGPLQPRDEVILRAQVNGTLAGLRVNRGSVVADGQRLATVRAAGVVSGAAGAKAGVAAAEANLAVARKQREAARTLFAAGAISDIERQSAEAQYEAAAAQLAAARAQSTSADEAAGYTSINAPFRGVVSKRWRQDGESVKPGDEVLTVVDSRVLELAGQIGVADAARVRVGQQVSFALDAFPGEQFNGRVARIDPVADAGTRQVGVYVELNNAKGRIVGGQYARGRLEIGSSSAVVVPLSAVQRAAADSANAYVFVIANNLIVKRAVTLGARDDLTGMIAVTSGIAVGDQLIRNPTGAIADGLKVRMLAADQVVPTTSTPAKPKE